MQNFILAVLVALLASQSGTASAYAGQTPPRVNNAPVLRPRMTKRDAPLRYDRQAQERRVAARRTNAVRPSVRAMAENFIEENRAQAVGARRFGAVQKILGLAVGIYTLAANVVLAAGGHYANMTFEQGAALAGYSAVALGASALSYVSGANTQRRAVELNRAAADMEEILHR